VVDVAKLLLVAVVVPLFQPELPRDVWYPGGPTTMEDPLLLAVMVTEVAEADEVTDVDVDEVVEPEQALLARTENCVEY